MTLCEKCKNQDICDIRNGCDPDDEKALVQCYYFLDKHSELGGGDVVTDGLKHDGGKPMLALVPSAIIRAVGTVMTHGAEKYGEGNYRKVEPARYRDALMRHICKWLKNPHGKDEDSGLPHLWHIACNVAFLLELDKPKIDKEILIDTKTLKKYGVITNDKL